MSTTILRDDAGYTMFRDVNPSGSVCIRIVSKPGSEGFNLDALISRATQIVADCNTAEALVNTSGWDGLTAPQRKTIMLGILQALRADARLTIGDWSAAS